MHQQRRILLARLGVRDPAAAQFIRSDATARVLLSGRGGKMVQAQTNADCALQGTGRAFPGRARERPGPTSRD